MIESNVSRQMVKDIVQADYVFIYKFIPVFTMQKCTISKGDLILHTRQSEILSSQGRFLMGVVCTLLKILHKTFRSGQSGHKAI